MNKKTSPNIGAVIEIASNAVRMNISQLKKGEISVIDELEYPINLGYDAYNEGKITFENLRLLFNVLSKYQKVMDEYGAGKRAIISCSVLREAENSDFITDRIETLTGIKVDILEESAEKSYIYYHVLSNSDSKPSTKSSNQLIVYVGTGSVGIAVYDGKCIKYTQNISVGSLKMHDVLGGLRHGSEAFYTVIEEYIDTVIKPLELSSFDLGEVYIIGPDVSVIAKLTGAIGNNGYFSIDYTALRSLHKKIRGMTAENISFEFDITENEAVTLYNSLFLFIKTLKYSGVKKKIGAVNVDITNIWMRHLLLLKTAKEYNTFIRSSSVICSSEMASTWNFDENNAKFISTNSCNIFDKLKKIHGLSSSNRTILKCSSILYNCCTSLGLKHNFASTYNIIRNLDIFGLTSNEMDICAFLSASVFLPRSQAEETHFLSLPVEKQIIISKLSAIFKLAAALDKSEIQKLTDIKIILSEDKLTVRASTALDPSLERWAFERVSEYFRDVFGIYTELIVKSQFLS